MRNSATTSLQFNFVNGNHIYSPRPQSTPANANRNYLSRDEVNGNNLTSYKAWMRQQSDKFEIPLPFGYHMDLDFLRCCSEEMVSGETLDRLKELRKQRRKQRKTLEALMGIRQEEMREKLRSETMTTSLSVATRNSPQQPKQLQTSQLLIRHKPDVALNTPEFVRDALKDAVKDFEKTLERSKDDDKAKQERASPPSSGGSGGNISNIKSVDLLSGAASSTKCSKFNTFPRALSSPEDHNMTSTFKLYRQSSNSSISSISTSSSAIPYGHTPLSPEAVLNALPSSVPPKHQGDNIETESITSITSDMSTHTLKNIREQMARSLAKLKEYEKQVEAIPVMQVKLSVMKEEKRLLLLKLKQRELQLRRERGELDESDLGGPLDYETEDELDLDESRFEKNLGREAIKRRFAEEFSSSRARSESPYAKSPLFDPEDFISVQKRRSASACGYNSDSDLISERRSRYYEQPRVGHLQQHQRLSKSSAMHNLSMSHIVDKDPRVSAIIRNKSAPPKNLRDASTNTDKARSPSPPPRPPSPPPAPPPVRKRDRAVNTDPPPKSPPPPRKISHGTNTLPVRSLTRGMETMVKMDSLVTKEEMEAKVQEAIFRTEEEIMGCPLLQKAMAVVEDEAINGPRPPRPAPVEGKEFGCQVGDDNLRPFVISVGLQCKLDETHPIVLEKVRDGADNRPATPGMERRLKSPFDHETEKLVRTIGVGECKVIEDPKEPAKYREIGICTEKWVEVIKASKQTDTEDFAYKDTESPRVADMVFEPSPERVVLERRSSLRNRGGVLASPSASRKSSTSSPVSSRRPSTAPAKPVTR